MAATGSREETHMTAEEWTLAATCFFSGLASGLLGMLCTILRPMQRDMDGPAFRDFMQKFVWYAADLPGLPMGKVFNYAWSLGMTIGPIVALVLLWDDPGSTAFVLTAIGLGIVVVGILIVSNVWKTPTYRKILAWDPEVLPPEWEQVRNWYFTINWIQFATTWTAFALFLVALIAL
jgi:hypothetical protein